MIKKLKEFYKWLFVYEISCQCDECIWLDLEVDHWKKFHKDN